MRHAQIVEAGNNPVPLDLLIKDGKISGRLLPGTRVDAAIPVLDAEGLHIFPGLIDAHVHFGFGEKITEYSTETVYAAQGGFTSILGYFLNNEAYGAVFEREQEYARVRAHVDYGFHFSVANEQHVCDMATYVRDYGVTSFKYFMNFKGEEGRYLGLDGTDDGYLFNLLRTAGGIHGVKVVCHTENIEIVNRLRTVMKDFDAPTLKDWASVKPPFTEAESCIRAMYFAEHFGAHIYIPHLSTRMALDEVRRWRERYPHVYVETCPHYLTHDEDSDLGALGRANPPFRSKDDVAAMWEGLQDGSIDVVASDHVPRKKATKERPFWLASQGFPGTATILPVLLSEGYHKGRLSLARIAEVLTEAPSKIFGMAPQKGSLSVGADADLTFVDLNRSRVVRAEELGSFSDYSLYDGWSLKGWPVRTIVRGETVMLDGEIVGMPGYGRYLSRPLASR
ncbi:dihydroorotase [Paraburkholderia nemoris]|uniref:dihydroorotase n=1 Tax=Paraburkholderia nemoris TaxID=2793076 RepID=UPI0038B76571